jgi:hypothetical protein
MCERFARASSDLLANRVKIRRQVVRDNLRQAFPEWTPEQTREAARGMWEHLLLMVVEIGLITPPVGMNVFVINSLARDVPMKETFKFVMPFLVSDLLRIIAIVLFPGLVLFVFDLPWG